jgi:penicillin-binding protein 2
VYTTEPEPGDNVYLTIDEVLQENTENALASGWPRYQGRQRGGRRKKGHEIRMKRQEQQITGGAAVVVDVKTGEPLAIASWPTFDLSTLSRRILPSFQRTLPAAV